MPHPLIGADHWSRAARPFDSPREQKMRARIDEHEANASISQARNRDANVSLHRRLGDWLPRFGAWVRDIPLP